MIKRTLMILLAMATVASSTNAAPPNRLNVQQRNTLYKIVEAYLRENVNDPSKLDIVAWYVPVPLKPAYRWTGGHDPAVKRSGHVGPGGWRAINRTGWAVPCKYRASNALGAVMIGTGVFCVSGGHVILVYKQNDFSPIRPLRRQDPHTQQFMDLFNRAIRSKRL